MRVSHVLTVMFLGVLATGACGGGEGASTDDEADRQASPQDLDAPTSREEARDVVARRSAEARAAASEVAVDPCELLTRAEAEALLGGRVTARTNEELGFPNQCQYEPVQRQPGQFGLMVSIEGSYASPGRFYDTLERSAQQAEVETERVEGVGDAALWVDEMLWVLDGKRAFVVGFAKDLATARTAAEKVLPRL